MVGMPALSSPALFVTLSLNEVPRTRLKQRIMPGEQGTGFAAVQKGAHHTSLVHQNVRVVCEFAVCPDYFVQPGECGSCLSYASVELGLKGEAVRDC